MREQCFGMYLPVFILILMEVILMSQNSEGASTSVAKLWSKRSTGTEMKMEPSDTGYQLRNQADTGKTFRRGKRSGNVSRYPLMENRPWRRSNEGTRNLERNAYRSSLDSQTRLYRSLTRAAGSPMEREYTYNFKSNSLKKPNPGSAVTYVLDSMLTVLCRITRRLVYQLEPYTAVSNLILKIILNLIKVISPYVKEDNPELGAEPKNPIKELVDFFNPFIPAYDPKKPPQLDNDKSIILSMLDYFNPLKESSDFQKLTQSNKEPLDLVESLVDFLKPFNTIIDKREHSQLDDYRLVQSLAKKLGYFIRQRDSSEWSNRYVRPMVPYYFENDPFTMLGLPILPPISNPWPVLYSPHFNPKRRSPREVNDCSRIPNNYHKVGTVHRAYRLHIINLRWEDARRKCQSESAEIAWPIDQPQYDAIVEYAKRMLITTDLYFYLGFHRSLPNEFWKTVHDGVLNFGDLANATTVEDPAGKQCGTLHVSTTNHGEFANAPCTATLPFMCEIIIPAECV